MNERAPFSYTIRIEGNVRGSVRIAGVTHDGRDITDFVTSSSAGEFGWDEKGEYGPFNSFYAAFDSGGNMRYHMDARDLTRNVGGRKVVFTEKGLLLPDGTYSKCYSIVWVLPKIYVSSEGDDLTISDAPGSGGRPLAHSLDLDGDGRADREFEYLGFGVYASHVEGGKAYSMQGVRPTVRKNVVDFGRCTEAYELSGINPGYSMQWNWYQWSLLRYCTYAALGTFDSQSFAKGNVCGVPGRDMTLDTGMTAAAVNGYYANDDGLSSERLFIENAWGNIFAWLSNTFFDSDGLYASQSPAGQRSSKGEGMRKILTYSHSIGRFGRITHNPGMIETDSAESWGCPVFDSEAEESGIGDLARAKSTYHPIARVGGSWDSGTYAGVSMLSANHTVSKGCGVVGSRQVLLFNNDPVRDGSALVSSSESGPEVEASRFESEAADVKERPAAKGGFFSDTRDLGLVALVLAFFEIITGLVCFTELKIGGKGVHSAAGGIGLILTAAVTVLIAYGIYRKDPLFRFGGMFEDMNSYFGVLIAYLSLTIVTDLINGICLFFGGTKGIIAGTVCIALGFVSFLAIHFLIHDSGMLAKLVYCVVFVLFAIGIVAGAVACIGIITIPVGILTVLLYLMLVRYLVSEEVRAKIGV